MRILHRTAVLAPFQVRSYRYQWPADLLTSWAFEMETIILGWYVLVESGSVVLLAAFGALQFFGSILGPLSGAAGDRLGHRQVLSALRASYAALALLLAGLAIAGSLSPTIVLIIAFLNGLVRPSDMGVRSALVGASVPREHLMAAIALSRVTSDSARVIGALSGASVFTAFGMAHAYAAIVIFYLVGVLLTLQTEPMTEPAKFEAAVHVPTSLWQNLRDGLLHSWSVPSLRATMWVAFLVNLVGFPVSMGLLPHVARSIYGLDQTGLGYLVASFSCGALIGSIGLSVAGHAVPFARTMLIGTAGWFVMLLIFAQLQSPILGGITLLVAGFFQSLCIVPMSVVILRVSDAAFRGRVMGVRMLAIYSLPIGLMVGGALFNYVGFPFTVTLFASIGILFTGLIAMRWHDNLWLHEAAANCS
jgi:predicted MFS family arabinose efflux permease